MEEGEGRRQRALPLSSTSFWWKGLGISSSWLKGGFSWPRLAIASVSSLEVRQQTFPYSCPCSGFSLPYL